MTREFSETMSREPSAGIEEASLMKHSVRLFCAMNHNYVHRGNERLRCRSSFRTRIFPANSQDSFHVFFFFSFFFRIILRELIM